MVWSWWESNSFPIRCSPASRYAGEHLWMHMWTYTLNLDADEPRAQNWTIADLKKMLPGLMSLKLSDSRNKIWHNQLENMDPHCPVSTVQTAYGSVMVWAIFLWYNLGPFVMQQPTWISFLTISTPWWPQCACLLIAASSRRMHYNTQIIST